MITKKKIALVGLGPHSKRIYYPFLEAITEERDDVSFDLLIDIESKREDVEAFVANRSLKVDTCLIDDEGQIHPDVISGQAKDAIEAHGITHVIVGTEPKAHKAYLIYCIENGLPVIVDKPLTAPEGLMTPHDDAGGNAAQQLMDDYFDIDRALDAHPESRVLIQCQRRHHDGYLFVLSKLRQLVEETRIPITHIYVHHSDGTWSMPDEYGYRENHPYKYGYGKLFHSGYHFVDLLDQVQSVNDILDEKKTTSVSVFNQFLRPVDHLTLFNNEDYKRLLKAEGYEGEIARIEADDVSLYGEVDLYGQLQYSKDGKVITTAQISMTQSGFTQRAWTHLPKDTYKGNGRVRHESLSVHVGPLMNIQVHSYQEAQIHEGIDKTGVGGVDHFDIYIFRNSNLLGGKPFEKITYGDDETEEHGTNARFLGHNEEARKKIIYELLDELPSNSELRSHKSPISLLATLCDNQARQQAGKIPYAEYNYEEFKNGSITF